jgi:hypothetical protein
MAAARGFGGMARMTPSRQQQAFLDRHPACRWRAVRWPGFIFVYDEQRARCDRWLLDPHGTVVEHTLFG